MNVVYFDYCVLAKQKGWEEKCQRPMTVENAMKAPAL
jgi:hypothetical protein